jgi:hypothetical protein
VQNVIPEYLENETSKNKDWEKHAEKWLPLLQKEMDGVDPHKKKPVLVTAERIMKFLVNDGYKIPTAKAIYSNNSNNLLFIKASDNKLGRPLLAFYRHPSYSLIKQTRYCSFLKKSFI